MACRQTTAGSRIRSMQGRARLSRGSGETQMTRKRRGEGVTSQARRHDVRHPTCSVGGGVHVDVHVSVARVDHLLWRQRQLHAAEVAQGQCEQHAARRKQRAGVYVRSGLTLNVEQRQGQAQLRQQNSATVAAQAQ